MSIAARSPSGTDDAEDRIDALLAELDPEQPYRTSYRTLLMHATADFDRAEPYGQGILDSDTGIMCPSCVEDLEEDGVDAALDGWHRKDPYCTVVTDVDEVPARFREDRDTEYEEYAGVLCPDHPEVFIAYADDGYR